jgi:hypothetical protein
LIPCLGIVTLVVDITKFWSMEPSANSTEGVLTLKSIIEIVRDLIILLDKGEVKVKKIWLPEI